MRLELAWFHDRPDLCRIDDLGVIGKTEEVFVCGRDGPIVVSRICLCGNDVDNVVGRTPTRSNRVSYPYQAVQAMLQGQSLLHNAIEFLARLRVFDSPPEAHSLRFVQRPPQHGYTGVLWPLELNGKGIDVVH